MKKFKVLIAEDAASMRKFTRFGLEKSFAGIIVDEATNGKEAQSKLEQGDYDLILCDWEMPDLTGDQILQWVRSHPTLSGIPFIMVTSRNDRPSVLKAIEMGANSYVVKPFTAEALAQKIIGIMDRFDRREFERYEAHGEVVFHFRNAIARGKMIDLSLGGLLSVLSSKNPLPAILERVAIDITLEAQETVSGLEAFVIRIQAAEAFPDTEHVKYAVKLLDLDAEKQQGLKRIIETLKSKAAQK